MAVVGSRCCISWFESPLFVVLSPVGDSTWCDIADLAASLAAISKLRGVAPSIFYGWRPWLPCSSEGGNQRIRPWFSTFMFLVKHCQYGGSINGGTPKWMVYSGNWYWNIGWIGRFRKHPYCQTLNETFRCGDFFEWVLERKCRICHHTVTFALMIESSN